MVLRDSTGTKRVYCFSFESVAGDTGAFDFVSASHLSSDGRALLVEELADFNDNVSVRPFDSRISSRKISLSIQRTNIFA